MTNTLGDLKTRIADELTRDDMTTQIASAITRAIEFYASKRFWFNFTTGTTTTTASQDFATQPTGLRVQDEAFVTIGTQKIPLDPQPFDTIIEWLGAAGSAGGQPTDYAIKDGQVYFYPQPNAVFTITFAGLYDEAALSADGSSNAWTTEAQDLICARAKKTINRDILRDAEAAAADQAAENEALSILKTETAARLSTGRNKPSE